MRINWCDKHNLVGGAWCAMKDKAAGPCRMVPMRLIPDNADLHGLIADAIWIASNSDSLESACEFADLVLEALGWPKVSDGPSRCATPFPHSHVLDSALGLT